MTKYVAWLTYDGKNYFENRYIPNAEPIIKYYQSNLLSVNESNAGGAVLIFKRTKVLNNPKIYNNDKNIEYLFSHTEVLPEYSMPSFDVGFMEPNKDINLDKLTVKLKKGLNIKNLIKDFLKKEVA